MLWCPFGMNIQHDHMQMLSKINFKTRKGGKIHLFAVQIVNVLNCFWPRIKLRRKRKYRLIQLGQFLATFRILWQVKPVNGPLVLHQPCIVSYVASQRASSKAPGKLVVAQFRMPDEAKMRMNAVKEQLWKSLPDSIKELPWKKVGDQLLKLLLSHSKEAFKWSFIAWFFLSFPSDILFAISRNQELMMPFGLFAGCFLADFMRETSEELFQQAQVLCPAYFFSDIFVFLNS